MRRTSSQGRGHRWRRGRSARAKPADGIREAEGAAPSSTPVLSVAALQEMEPGRSVAVERDLEGEAQNSATAMESMASTQRKAQPSGAQKLSPAALRAMESRAHATGVGVPLRRSLSAIFRHLPGSFSGQLPAGRWAAEPDGWPQYCEPLAAEPAKRHVERWASPRGDVRGRRDARGAEARGASRDRISLRRPTEGHAGEALIRALLQPRRTPLPPA